MLPYNVYNASFHDMLAVKYEIHNVPILTMPTVYLMRLPVRNNGHNKTLPLFFTILKETSCRQRIVIHFKLLDESINLFFASYD